MTIPARDGAEERLGSPAPPGCSRTIKWGPDKTCEPRKMGTIKLDVAMFKLGLEGDRTTQRAPWSFNKVGSR